MNKLVNKRLVTDKLQQFCERREKMYNNWIEDLENWLDIDAMAILIYKVPNIWYN